MKKCSSLGEGLDGKPCDSYVRGKCRSDESCIYQTNKPLEDLAKNAENIDVPDRITELLARIADGNFKIDDAFINSHTYKSLYKAGEIASLYDPTSDAFDSTRLEDPDLLEADGLHLAALNTRIGQVLGLLQADVEGLESYLKELEAKKSLEIENSFRMGLRPGGYNASRVRSVVAADEQVVQAKSELMVVKRRKMIVSNMCDRVESTINMIKKRADGLRRRKQSGLG